MCTRLILSFGAEHLYDVHVRDVVKKLVELGQTPSWNANWPFTGFIRTESIESWRPRFLRDSIENAEIVRVHPVAFVEGGVKVRCTGSVTFVLVRDFQGVTGWRLITTDAKDDPVGVDSRGNRRKPWGTRVTEPRQMEFDLKTA